MKKIIYFFALVFLVFILGWTTMVGLEKEEKRECLQWQRWAQELKVFYLAPWQKDQCDHWGIKVNAPVMK